MNEEMYVIWSYEHNGWWKPGEWGYTHDLREAGRYPEERAKQVISGANSHGQINEALILISAIRPYSGVKE